MAAIKIHLLLSDQSCSDKPGEGKNISKLFFNEIDKVLIFVWLAQITV